MNAFFYKCAYRVGLVTAVLLGQAAPSQAAIFLTDEALAMSEEYAQNFPQVGFLYVHSEVRGWQGGSATYAVNDLTAITAAHVLAGDDGFGGGIDEVRFYTGPSVAGYTAFAYASDWHQHPEYAPNGQGYGDFDIAVVNLQTAIGGVAPVPLYTGVLVGGMEVSAAGFGVAGTNATGEVIDDQVLRAGTNVISGFGGDVGSLYRNDHPSFVFTRFGDFNSPSSFLEWQGSNGDSGGGLFVGNELAGVISFGFQPNYPGLVVGNSTGIVQIAPFSGWISEMAATPVPEPSTMLLLTAGLMGVGTRYRRATLRKAD
jgi:hypothetical protein